MNVRSAINGLLTAMTGFRLERVRPSRRSVMKDTDTPSLQPIEDLGDLRFRVSAWAYSAPVEQMVGRPVFGYGPMSWHPLVAASRELIRDLDTTYESSVLRRFYETFTPSTIADAYRLGDIAPLAHVPASTLFDPWYLREPPFDDPYSSTFPPGSPLFGPLSKAAGEAQWARLRACVKSIMEYGYQPDLFPRGRINVIVLRSQGRERYLVAHGQHRAAVLSAMGATRVEVGIHTALPVLIDESEVDMWPYVKSGFLSRESAVRVLRRYFSNPETDAAVEIGAAVDSTLAATASARP